MSQAAGVAVGARPRDRIGSGPLWRSEVRPEGRPDRTVVLTDRGRPDASWSSARRRSVGTAMRSSLTPLAMIDAGLAAGQAWNSPQTVGASIEHHRLDCSQDRARRRRHQLSLSQSSLTRASIPQPPVTVHDQALARAIRCDASSRPAIRAGNQSASSLDGAGSSRSTVGLRWTLLPQNLTSLVRRLSARRDGDAIGLARRAWAPAHGRASHRDWAPASSSRPPRRPSRDG